MNSPQNIKDCFMSSCQARIIRTLVLMQLALFCSAASAQCAVQMDMSSMPSDTTVTIISDGASGVTQGIFWNKVKSKIVEIAPSCRVNPAGAGIYLGSADKPLPETGCMVVVRDAPKPGSNVQLQLGCKVRNLWYSATVINHLRLTDRDGDKETWGVARPSTAGVGSIVIRGEPSDAVFNATPGRNGQISGGKIEVAKLGLIEVLVFAKIGDTRPIFLLSSAAAKRLAAELPSSDAAAILKAVGP